MKTFDINLEQAARLQMELRQCVRKKNLVSFEIHDVFLTESSSSLFHIVLLYRTTNQGCIFWPFSPPWRGGEKKRHFLDFEEENRTLAKKNFRI
jgi:hypothetical protein